MRTLAVVVLVSTLSVGCASTPSVPSNYDFTRATIVAGDKDPEIDIDGLSGKNSGAVVGGASGAGLGLGYAAVACMPAFMFYGACLAITAPVLGGVGAVGGAAIGAVATQSAASVEEKRGMLNEALVAIDARNYLATLTKQQFQKRHGVVTLAADTALVPVQSSWTLRIALNEVSTDGSGEETAYFLKASASLEVMRTGRDEPLSRKEYHTQTQDRKTTAEWLANDDEPVRSALEGLLLTLATEILNDLMHVEPDGLALREGTNNTVNEPVHEVGNVVLVEFNDGTTKEITITNLNNKFLVGNYVYSGTTRTQDSFDRRSIRKIRLVNSNY